MIVSAVAVFQRRTALSKSSCTMSAPFTAPIDVPVTMSNEIPSSRSAFQKPT